MTEKIIEKISRYNLFNYLFPGVLFMILSPTFGELSLLNFFDQNLIVSLFLAYFIGMVISRVGSIFIEYILKKIKFIEFVKYSDFLIASQKDEKIEILSEENNVYRTLISLFSILILSYLFVYYIEYIQMSSDGLYLTTFTFCLVLFLLSYRKQTGYIGSRIKNNLNKQ